MVKLNITPTVFGSPITATATSALNKGTITVDSNSTVPGIMVIGNTAGTIGIQSHATATRLRGYRINGTVATPAALSGTAGLIQVEGYGYDGASAVAAGGVFQIRSVGTWSNTSHPSDMVFNVIASGATASQVALQLTTEASVVCGNAAIATNATDGFLYITSCAGAATGTPTSNTGRVPIVYDTTNNRLYAYNGAWKSVTLA